MRRLSRIGQQLPVAHHQRVIHVVGRPLEIELEAEPIAVVGNRRLQVFDDEKRGDGEEFGQTLILSVLGE